MGKYTAKLTRAQIRFLSEEDKSGLEDRMRLEARKMGLDPDEYIRTTREAFKRNIENEVSRGDRSPPSLKLDRQCKKK